MKILFILLSFFMSSAQAAEAGIVSIAQTVTDAIKLAGTDKIMPLALMWIGAFFLIQFTITNIGLLKSGADLEAVWAKFLGSLFWFFFCIYLLNNGPDFIDAVGGGILERFAGFPKPGWIITSTLLLCIPFIAAIAAVGVVNTTLAMILMTAMLTVLSVGMMLALKIMMLTIELGLVVMLSPLSFSLLGLNALKDQGIAPLKSLLSLIYRIILLSVICIAFTEVLSVSEQNLKNIGGAIQWLNPVNWPSIINTVISTVLAFPVIGYLIFKSDSIAATLAGGSSNMGSSDTASSAAMGAAVGAALGSAGGAGAASATKVPQSMAGFMSKLAGSASLSNASSRDAGVSADILNKDAPVRSSAASSSQPTNSMGAKSGSGGASPSSNFAGSSGGSKDAGTAMQPGAATQAAPERSKHKSMQALLGDSQNAQRAARASGAEPRAAQAAGDAAYAGKSPQDIESATMAAGGTQEQGRAAADAVVTGVAPVRPAASPTAGAATPASGDFASALASDAGSPSPGATSTGDAPVRPPAGSAVGEAIAGVPTSMDDLKKAIEQQNAPRKPTTLDRLGNANNHIAQEKAATHVSINVNAAD